ncbi:MAG: hypothetical protein HC845_13130 [Akkermansiaceae bacterium]|nr:hypothetical protein [Akkermansiaceae bacterium]
MTVPPFERRSISLKATYYIPIGLAAAGLIFWTVYQQREASGLTTKTQALQQQIEKAKREKSALSSPTTGSQKPSRKSTSPGEPIDWKKLAARMMELQKDDQDVDDETVNRFEVRLEKMSREELIAALDEISTLGLDEEGKSLLEETLVETLIAKDPGYVLQRYADRIQNDEDGVGWQLSEALGEWARTDLKAATAWFDKEIATGKFESKSLNGQSEARLEFEAALLGKLLSSDAKAASARIEAIPKDLRATAMQQMDLTEMSPAGQQEYVKLIRELLPEDERMDSFTHVLSEIFEEANYQQIGSFLDNVKATPEEREVAAKDTATLHIENISPERPITRSDIEEMRTWLKQQTPNHMDHITGQALAEAMQDNDEFDFPKASALALEVHKSTGNDNVLIGFLSDFSDAAYLEQAIALAESIKDPNRRKEVLENLK